MSEAGEAQQPGFRAFLETRVAIPGFHIAVSRRKIVPVDDAKIPSSSGRARPPGRTTRGRTAAVAVALAFLAALAFAAPPVAVAGGRPAKGAPGKPPPTKPKPGAPAAPSVPATPPAPPAPSATEPIPWWDKAWSHRRVMTLAVSGPLAPHTGSASFTTHGTMSPDGRDLRVVGPDGAPVGVELLEVGPGDVVSFLFEAKDPVARYVAYWGCAAPKTPSPAWTRDGGLVCEVRRWDAPFPVNVPYDAEFALRVAKDVEARVLRPKIFDGMNPGGPSATYVASYRGFFRVAEAGDYDLCTASNGASILRVEQSDVTLWSSSRGPWSAQRGEFRLRVHLEAGNHPIEYLHFQAGGGQQAAVVGIRKAAEQAWRVLWDADYVQPIAAEAGRAETAAGVPPADFTWTTVQHFDAGGAHLVRMRFEAASMPAGTPGAWDFGDGRTGAGSPIEHVFVGRGVRTVRLSGDDGKGRTVTGAQRVAVNPLWTQLVPVAPGSEPAWSAALAQAAAAGLAASEIAPALKAARALDSDELEKAVAEDAFARAEGLSGAVRVDVFLALATFFDTGKTWDAARRARALSLATSAPDAPPAAAARAAVAAAEEAAERGDGAAALKFLEGRRAAELGEDGMRRAALVRADVLVSLGKVEEAERTIVAVSDRAAEDRRTAEASRRARLHAVSAWIAGGDAAAAVDGARDVLDDFPKEHLRAEGPVLLADAWLHLDEPQRAITCLERALVLEPDGPATPRALLLLATARTRAGDANGAATARARLSTEFPYSEEAAEVARPPTPGR